MGNISLLRYLIQVDQQTKNFLGFDVSKRKFMSRLSEDGWSQILRNRWSACRGLLHLVLSKNQLCLGIPNESRLLLANELQKPDRHNA